MTEAMGNAFGLAATPARPTRSRSLLGAAAAVVALIVLAVVHWGPGLLAGDGGIVKLAPSLFEPGEAQRGVHDLGDGVRVSLFLSGLRVDVDGVPVLKTTERAAPVAVLEGRLRTSRDGATEEVGAEQRVLTVDQVEASGSRVRFGGVATMSDGRRVRVIFAVAAVGPGRFTLSVSSDEPVGGFVVALDPRFTLIVAPHGDARRTWAWWSRGRPELAPARVGGYRAGRPWALAVSGGPVAVDRRTDGAAFVHVWGARPTLTFTAPTVGP
jgi:hypothetical protein